MGLQHDLPLDIRTHLDGSSLDYDLSIAIKLGIRASESKQRRVISAGVQNQPNSIKTQQVVLIALGVLIVVVFAVALVLG